MMLHGRGRSGSNAPASAIGAKAPSGYHLRELQANRMDDRVTRDPTGARNSFLSGVSCPTTVSCLAVGGSDTGDPPRTLVERGS